MIMTMNIVITIGTVFKALKATTAIYIYICIYSICAVWQQDPLQCDLVPEPHWLLGSGHGHPCWWWRRVHTHPCCARIQSRCQSCAVGCLSQGTDNRGRRTRFPCFFVPVACFAQLMSPFWLLSQMRRCWQRQSSEALRENDPAFINQLFRLLVDLLLFQICGVE